MTTGRVTFSTLMDLCVSVALRAQVTMCGFSDDLSSRFVCLKKKKLNLVSTSLQVLVHMCSIVALFLWERTYN